MRLMHAVAAVLILIVCSLGLVVSFSLGNCKVCRSGSALSKLDGPDGGRRDSLMTTTTRRGVDSGHIFIFNIDKLDAAVFHKSIVKTSMMMSASSSSNESFGSASSSSSDFLCDQHSPSSSSDSRFPLGLVIARGSEAVLTEERMGLMDDILTGVVGADANVPVVVLSARDESQGLTLQRVFDEELFQKRDHELPLQDMRLALGDIPVIILAGFERQQAMLFIRTLRGWDAPESGRFPRCAFAICVEPALKKPLFQLMSEIQGDFKEEMQRSKVNKND